MQNMLISWQKDLMKRASELLLTIETKASATSSEKLETKELLTSQLSVTRKKDLILSA